MKKTKILAKDQSTHSRVAVKSKNILKNKSKTNQKNNYLEKSKLNQDEKKKTSVQLIKDLAKFEAELVQSEDPPVTEWEKNISSSRLCYSFYDSPSETLAKNLLGKILVRKLEDGSILKGRIVETESYLGSIDKASATYQGKVTSHNIPLYMQPGTIFVYLTYGMYHCFNISCQGEGSSVFLRAVEPIEGIDKMEENRDLKSSKKVSKSTTKILKPHELCAGPAKMCRAFNITRELNKYSMCSYKGLWIEEDSKKNEFSIVSCSRIGIDSAGTEWANKPLRFYILGNKSVSKRDKKAEAQFE